MKTRTESVEACATRIASCIAFGVASVVFEFPSGYLADRVGYRTALLTGAMLWVVGWTLYAVATTFTQIAFGEVVLGAGNAFVSGADSALLFSSRHDLLDWAAGLTRTSTRLAEGGTREGRVRAAGQACEAGSAAMGGWLYALAPRLPFWLQVPNALAAVSLVAMMPQPSRERRAVTTPHLERMWHVVRTTLRHRRLRTAMQLSVTLGLSTFMMVWLIQPWMQRRGIPVAWFGPIWAAAHLWLAAVSLASARVADAFWFS